jgi:hypothetical protein
MTLLAALLANPALVLRQRNILLLSHMRANTSLFGHLLGSHPLVEGYYEQHIGYYSWKSLWRAKALHFAEHAAKPGARWMFDKVLHDGHGINPSLLCRPSCRPIMMLRAPHQTLPSIVALYRKEHPDLPEARPEGATRYYVERLQSLAAIASRIGSKYCYLDAECLVEDTSRTLTTLGDWLGFEVPIPTQYEPFARTGRRDAGDTSSRLRAGRVVPADAGRYNDIAVPLDMLEGAEATYARCRALLLAGSGRSAVRSDAAMATPVTG